MQNIWSQSLLFLFSIICNSSYNLAFLNAFESMKRNVTSWTCWSLITFWSVWLFLYTGCQLQFHTLLTAYLSSAMHKIWLKMQIILSQWCEQLISKTILFWKINIAYVHFVNCSHGVHLLNQIFMIVMLCEQVWRSEYNPNVCHYAYNVAFTIVPTLALTVECWICLWTW